MHSLHILAVSALSAQPPLIEPRLFSTNDVYATCPVDEDERTFSVDQASELVSVERWGVFDGTVGAGAEVLALCECEEE